MEKASPITSFSLSEVFGLLLLQAVLYWASRLQKLSSRFLNFLQPDYAESSKPSTMVVSYDQLAKKVTTNLRGDAGVSHEDVETVMGLLGMSGNQEGEQLKAWIGFDELSGMFEEKEATLEEVKEAFSVFDENGDGFIDAVELQRIILKIGFVAELTLDACVQMIAAFDENQDGRIDFHEFVKFLESSFC